MTPPLVPPNYAYTPCYYEESIYLLAQVLSASVSEPRVTHIQNDLAGDPFVAFVSNDQKSVCPGRSYAYPRPWQQVPCRETQTVLWQRKARDGAVVWNYRAVRVLRPRPLRKSTSHTGETAAPTPAPWVYDLDSRLPHPCPWKVRPMFCSCSLALLVLLPRRPRRLRFRRHASRLGLSGGSISCQCLVTTCTIGRALQFPFISPYID